MPDSQRTFHLPLLIVVAAAFVLVIIFSPAAAAATTDDQVAVTVVLEIGSSVARHVRIDKLVSNCPVTTRTGTKINRLSNLGK
jgi:hypothetical protein